MQGEGGLGFKEGGGCGLQVVEVFPHMGGGESGETLKKIKCEMVHS